MPGLNVYFGGGLNENAVIHPAEAAAGSVNFDLDSFHGGCRPRRQTTSNTFTAAQTALGGLSIRGFFQMVKRDGKIYNGASGTGALSNGFIWNVTDLTSSTATYTVASATFTSATPMCRGTYWALDDFMVLTDLNLSIPVQRWDGTTSTTLTTGLAGTLCAKYSAVFNGRVWLFNLKEGATNLPHVIAVSAFDNPTDYDTTLRAGSSTFTSGTEAFYMTTPDLRPVNGVVAFYNQIIISTEGGGLYRITGTDSTDYAITPLIGLTPATGDEGIVSCGGDKIVYVTRNREVVLIQATDTYGDVARQDLSQYIPYSKRNYLSQFNTRLVYDPSVNCVYFFNTDNRTFVLVLSLEALLNGVIVDDKGNRARLSPWTVYQMNAATDAAIASAMGFIWFAGLFYGLSTGSTLANFTQIPQLIWGGGIATFRTADTGGTLTSMTRVTRPFGADDGMPVSSARGALYTYDWNSGSSLTISSVYSHLGTLTPYTFTVNAPVRAEVSPADSTAKPYFPTPFTMAGLPNRESTCFFRVTLTTVTQSTFRSTAFVKMAIE